MKTTQIIAVVTIVLGIAAQALGMDAWLLTVKTSNGGTVTIPKVSENCKVCLTVNETQVRMGDVTSVNFTETPDYKLNADGSTFLVGDAVIQTRSGATLKGEAFIPTDVASEDHAGVTIRTRDGRTMSLLSLTADHETRVKIGSKTVDLAEVKAITFTGTPEFKMTSAGHPYKTVKAEISLKNGKVLKGDLSNVDAWLGQSAEGPVTLPVADVASIDFSI